MKLVDWSKPPLKIRAAITICWNYLGLFRDYSWDHILGGMKVLFFKLESWSFQKIISWNPKKFHLIQHIQTICSSNFFIGCLVGLSFCELSQFFFFEQTLKISAFYLEKQRSFIPEKIWAVGQDSSNRWRLAVPIFSDGCGFDDILINEKH